MKIIQKVQSVNKHILMKKIFFCYGMLLNLVVFGQPHISNLEKPIINRMQMDSTIRNVHNHIYRNQFAHLNKFYRINIGAFVDSSFKLVKFDLNCDEDTMPNEVKLYLQKVFIQAFSSLNLYTGKDKRFTWGRFSIILYNKKTFQKNDALLEYIEKGRSSFCNLWTNTEKFPLDANYILPIDLSY